MKFKLIELSEKNEILKTYDIYKNCMFMPSKEKFDEKIDRFLSNNFIKIFACLYCGEIKGVIIISFLEQHKIEIIGIAVDLSVRRKGIASFMIKKLSDDYNLISVYAETDYDAIDFYRKNGFKIERFSKVYEGENVTRYKCELTNTLEFNEYS